METKVVLASRNKKKISELKSLFSSNGIELEVLSLDDIGYFDEIEENGTTFEENSKIKASVPASLGYIGIADDSGLCVDYLNGAPGVYSARFAGEDCSDDDNNELLLNKLSDVEYENRKGKFVSVISCVFPDDRPCIVARGECPGFILTSPRGENGFGYDPLFYYPEFDKTFAELSHDEKNKISHRGIAMNLFIEKLSKIIKKN